MIAETGLPTQLKGNYEFRAFEVITNNNGGLAAQGKIVWLATREIRQDKFAAYATAMNAPHWMLKSEVTAKIIAPQGVAGFPEPSNTGYIATDAIAIIKQGTRVKYEATHQIAHQVEGESYQIARCSFPDNDVKDKINGGVLSGAWVILTPESAVTIAQAQIEVDRLQSFGTDSIYTVKAGDPIGYLGLYEIPDAHNTRDLKKTIRMIHFEQFSKDEPPEAFFKLFMKEEAAKKLIRIEDRDSDGYLDANEPPTFFEEMAQFLSDTPEKKRVRVEEMMEGLSGWDRCKPVVACHESEWYEEEKRFLDRILEQYTHPDTEELVGHEKGRIKNLVWMQQESKIKFEKHVWHWWPVQRNCFCNRNITSDEVKKIVKVLRTTEDINDLNLFTASNCKIPNADKTYESFTEELNKAMNRYNINSCLRKAHFLAQVYHETDRLRTTQEYQDGRNYDPDKNTNANEYGNSIIGDGPKYKGRGLMQLTWKNNYKKYKVFQGVDCVTNYEIISDKLFYAVDSAGWYWTKGSVWGDLNPKADEDDLYFINIGVNGGSNGFSNRKKYIKALMDIMIIKGCMQLSNESKIGVYKLCESSMADTKYVKNHPNIKARLEGFDDE